MPAPAGLGGLLQQGRGASARDVGDGASAMACGLSQLLAGCVGQLARVHEAQAAELEQTVSQMLRRHQADFHTAIKDQEMKLQQAMTIDEEPAASSHGHRQTSPMVVPGEMPPAEPKRTTLSDVSLADTAEPADALRTKVWDGPPEVPHARARDRSSDSSQATHAILRDTPTDAPQAANATDRRSHPKKKSRRVLHLRTSTRTSECSLPSDASEATGADGFSFDVFPREAIGEEGYPCRKSHMSKVFHRRLAMGSSKPCFSKKSQTVEVGSMRLWLQPRGRLQFVHTPKFGMCAMLVILANSIYVGVSMDLTLRRDFQPGQADPTDSAWCEVIDLCFALMFTAELSLRMAAGFEFFWRGPERLWNVFDSVVVASAILESLLLTFSSMSVTEGLSVIRTVRLIRIVRVIRFAHHIPMFSNLRTMLHSLTNCVESFMPALLLLCMVMYIFGLSFMQGCISYIEEVSKDSTVLAGAPLPELELRFGSLAATFWTLLGMVSGGVDWLDVAVLIRKLGPFYVVSLITYINFVQMGLMNILTGIFVNAAHQASALNREIAIDQTISTRKAIVGELMRLFIEVFADCEHPEKSLSWEEFESKFTDERIKAYFLSLDLDMSSVSKVYDVIDAEGTGEIELDEFVEACVNFRGTAKAVDFVIMQRQVEQLAHQLDFVEARIRECTAPNVRNARPGTFGEGGSSEPRQARMNEPAAPEGKMSSP